MVIWEGIQNLSDGTRHQVSNFFASTSLQKHTFTDTPTSPDKHFFFYSTESKFKLN